MSAYYTYSDTVPWSVIWALCALALVVIGMRIFLIWYCCYYRPRMRRIPPADLVSRRTHSTVVNDVSIARPLPDKDPFAPPPYPGYSVNHGPPYPGSSSLYMPGNAYGGWDNPGMPPSYDEALKYCVADPQSEQPRQ